MSCRPYLATAGAATATALLVGSAIAGLAASNATPHGSLKASTTFVSIPGDGPGGCVESGPTGNVVTCHVTLSNPKSSNGAAITWAVVGTPSDTDTVTPSSGTLGVGKSVKVTMVTGCYAWSAFDFLDTSTGLSGAPVMFTCG
jgi:hypothetical protein